MEQLIADALTALGLPRDKAPLLAQYGALLAQRNKVVNLTAITDPVGIATLHMADCASLAAHWPMGGRTLIDVGTGAGFPGLVLAILEPTLSVTLLDPLQKRLDFLAEVCKVLSLHNVRLLHGRGEDGGRDPDLRERFDFAAARAVADLTVLAELCLPFVKVGGTFLAMKAVDSVPEAQRARERAAALGGTLGAPWDYPVYGAQVTHRVWPVEKTGPTPGKYPRAWSRIKAKG